MSEETRKITPVAGGGYVVENSDGTVTATGAARQTLAARLLADIVAERPAEPSLIPFETAHGTFHIRRMTWPEQTVTTLSFPRDASGFMSVEDAAAWQQFAAALLCNGVADADGAAAFTQADVAAWCAAPEMAATIDALFEEVAKTNPALLPKKNAD